MRRLVGCKHCRRQYDASGKRPGTRFHCHCGRPLVVVAAQPRDADVVRCISCGAPRREGESACGHCGSEFTLREQDLNTICPSCFARVSDHARYCHVCASPLTAEAIDAAATRYVCPACEPHRRLRSRQLGASRFSVLECPGCAGLWIGLKTLNRILELETQRAPSMVSSPTIRKRAVSQRYRPCAVCHALMPRRNFGNGESGIIVDVCGFHGLWFDDEEFAQLLNWARGTGGRVMLKELSKLAGSEHQQQRQARRAVGTTKTASRSARSLGASPKSDFQEICDAVVEALLGLGQS